MITIRTYQISAKHMQEKGNSWANPTQHNRITIKNTRTGDKAVFDYWGSVVEPKIKDRHLPDVFDRIIGDAISGMMALEEFCDEFGYGVKEGRKYHSACKATKRKLDQVIEHDLYDLSDYIRQLGDLFDSNKTYLGKLTSGLGITGSGENIFLKKHDWACDWYWSFGSIGNGNTSFHLKDIIFSGLSYNEIWESCELTKDEWETLKYLAQKAYVLSAAAEVYQYGGHQSSKAPRIVNLVSKDVPFNEKIDQDIEFLYGTERYFETQRKNKHSQYIEKDIEIQLTALTDAMLLFQNREDVLPAETRPSDFLNKILEGFLNKLWQTATHDNN